MSRKVGFGGSARPTSNAAPKTSSVGRTGFWERKLMPGEELLWQGRPGFRFKMDRAAFTLSMPALLGVTIFAALYYADPFGTNDAAYIYRFNNDLFVPLLIGAMLLYLVLYNLRHGLVHPGLTRYCVTNRRAMIANKLPFPNVRTYRLTPMTPIVWLGDDPGTITFGEENRQYGNKVVRPRKVGFHNVRDAAQIYGLLLKAKEGMV